MKDKHSIKLQSRLRRQKRVRKRIAGTSDRPRLAVFRSARHIYAQVIDDVSGKSLVSMSSMSPDIKKKRDSLKGKCEVAKEVGRLLSERAKEKNITQVVFDRAGFLYHGRVKAVADGAREGGLNF